MNPRVRPVFYRLALFLSLIAASPLAFAEEKTPEEVSTSTVTFIDKQQAIVSNAISNTMAWFDGFFAPPREEIETNDSFVRLIGNVTWKNREGVFFKPRIRARLRVPGLQKRLKLIVSGDDDEEQVTTRRTTSTTQPRQTTTRQTSETRDRSVGVQYTAFDWIESRLDFDLDVRSEFEPMGTARFRHKFKVNRTISGRFTETGFWREKVGFGEITQFDFEKTISSSTILSWNNRGTYSQKSNGLDWSSGLIYGVAVSSRIAINFQTWAQGSTRPHTVVTNYRAATQYRQNIWRPWFFYELEPAVDFNRLGAGGFETVPSATFRVEIMFRKMH